MNTRPIEVVGTFQGYWAQWARQVLARPEAIELHADPTAWQDFDTLLQKRTESKMLVLVEHPVIGLAHALAKGEDIDPEAWLDDWAQSAHALLVHVQRNPGATLVVNADDGRRRPQRLAQILRSRWGMSFDAPSRVAPDPRSDALTHALAWSLFERELPLQDLAAELLATCVVLPGFRDSRASLAPDDLLDAVEATRRLADLVQSELRLAQVESDREAERATLAQAEAQRDRIDRELAEARHAAQTAGEEGDILLRQLHQVQERLEQLTVERRESQKREAERREAEKREAQKRETQKREAERLEAAKREAQKRETENREAEKREAEKAVLAVKSHANADRLEKALRDSREECELLTLQSHQIQQELERLHARNLQLAHGARSQIALPGFDDVAIGEARVIGERASSPHRELSFIVRDVRVGNRTIPAASVRLVEHWGRPGLVIFADEGRPALLESWRESGREGEQPYMLLVHGEESAQRVYDAMGSLDWQLIQALATRLDQALQSQAGDLSPGWHALAQRLVMSLQELPARLRYDSVAVTPIKREASAPPRFGLTLERATYHGRSWRHLSMEWEPGGPCPSFALANDLSSGPPLLSWPADEDGSPVPLLSLPLGNDPNAQEVRAIWDSLSGSDRRFAAELLNLMPILAVHLQASATGAGDVSQADLQAAASANMLFGRLALQPLPAGPIVERRRPLLLRMLQRLGGVASVAEAMPSTNARAIER